MLCNVHYAHDLHVDTPFKQLSSNQIVIAHSPLTLGEVSQRPPFASGLTCSQRRLNLTHQTKSSWPQWLPGSLLSFTKHSVITWPLGHLPAPNHTEGLIQKLSVINYQLPTELRISEGIGTTVTVTSHWDYTLWGRKGECKPNWPHWVEKEWLGW